jgi:transcriptional regulator with XRE-family HTH domain
MDGRLQEQFGDNLRAHREAEEMSQEAFADFIDVHRTYLGSIERGKRNLTLKTVERISYLLGRDPLEMLTPPG